MFIRAITFVLPPPHSPPSFLSVIYDPDVDSQAGVECMGGSWDTIDVAPPEHCKDDVSIASTLLNPLSS